MKYKNQIAIFKSQLFLLKINRKEPIPEEFSNNLIKGNLLKKGCDIIIKLKHVDNEGFANYFYAYFFFMLDLCSHEIK